MKAAFPHSLPVPKRAGMEAPGLRASDPAPDITGRGILGMRKRQTSRTWGLARPRRLSRVGGPCHPVDHLGRCICMGTSLVGLHEGCIRAMYGALLIVESPADLPSARAKEE